ncbi:MAG: molybdopterin-binding protein [Candidatus Nezhaarchaeales archaeon]|nr:MAG: molybdopterin molybdenumtransferase MoeA [Candidatus Nezhaarchaeota archaeon WYZ-LMO8]
MKLTTLREALQRLEEVKLHLQVETLNSWEAFGRILAEDVLADIELPPFDKSARDGYAVKSKDTFLASESNPVKLKLKGHVKIGEIPSLQIDDGECAYIPTGAPLPSGSDAVVAIEDAHREGPLVYVFKAVAPNANVTRRGSDISKGTLVLRRGTQIGVKEVALLAALGRSKVKVYKKPRASIISTGPELVELGRPLREGKIYDVNGYMVYSYLSKLGLEPLIVGIADDDVKDLKEKMASSLDRSDIVIVSGGTSKGEGDVLQLSLIEILKERRGKILFHGLALKPGKPTLTAVVDEKLVVGLPGNPTSAFTVLEVMIKPWLLKNVFGSEFKERHVNAVLTRRVLSFEGRREIVYVKLLSHGAKLLAQPILKGSEAVTTFAGADGYIEIPEDIKFVEENSLVEVKLIDL